MKLCYFLILLLSCSVITQAQTVLTIKGATTGAPTLYINNGAYLHVEGGVNIDQAGGPSNASNNYLQNNGTIRIVSDSTPGQSDFANNVTGLNTYTSGQTTGEVVFSANNETQAITGSGTVEFMKLTTNNTLSPTLDVRQNVTVDGQFTLGGATAVINSNTLTLNSTYSSTGTLTGSSTSTITINGSSNLGSALTFTTGGQTLMDLNLNRLNVSGHTILLGSDLLIARTLSLQNGILNIQSHNLTLPLSASLAGAPYSAGNMIQADGTGQFIRVIGTGIGSYLFPIGDGAPAYSPIDLSFGTNAVAGTIGLNVKPAAHPQINNPIAATDYLNRYWTFSNTGITTYTYTGTFQYLPSDIVGTESAMKLSKWNNPWSAISASSAAANVLTITVAVDQTQSPLLGDFTGRNTLCSASSGQITASHDTTCAGNSELLTATGSSGNIQWQSSLTQNGFTDIIGADTASYTTQPLQQTTYYRTYISNGACHDSSSSFKLVVDSLPQPPLLTAGDSLICSTDSTQICAAGNYNSYLWNTGDRIACIYAKQAGGYWLTVTSTNGCSNVSSHTSIAVHTVPPVSILQQGDTIASFNAVSYQWYVNDTLIPNATSNYYIAHATGDYAVQITDTNGCTALSNTIHYDFVGIHELAEEMSFNIYPNPVSSGQLHINVSKGLAGSTAQIFDVSGRVVKADIITDEKMNVDVSKFASGFYTVCIKQNNVLIGTAKFVKD